MVVGGFVLLLKKGVDSCDGVFYLQELGCVCQLGGVIEDSEDVFCCVFGYYDEVDVVVWLCVFSLVSNIGVLLVNDNVCFYVVLDYECIFVYVYQVLNYWCWNDVIVIVVEL